MIVPNNMQIGWIAYKTRKEPSAPIEVGHRSCSACLLHQIAMKLKRKIYWDPAKEAFTNDDKEAMAMLSRPRRKKYDFNS